MPRRPRQPPFPHRQDRALVFGSAVRLVGNSHGLGCAQPPVGSSNYGAGSFVHCRLPRSCGLTEACQISAILVGKVRGHVGRNVVRLDQGPGVKLQSAPPPARCFTTFGSIVQVSCERASKIVPAAPSGDTPTSNIVAYSSCAHRPSSVIVLLPKERSQECTVMSTSDVLQTILSALTVIVLPGE